MRFYFVLCLYVKLIISFVQIKEFIIIRTVKSYNRDGKLNKRGRVYENVLGSVDSAAALKICCLDVIIAGVLCQVYKTIQKVSSLLYQESKCTKASSLQKISSSAGSRRCMT